MKIPAALFAVLPLLRADTVLLRVDTPRTPPPWAILERHLLAALDDAGERFVSTYTHPDGTLRWKERYEGGMNSSDDSYEGFRNLSLVHVLGGSRRLDQRHRWVWDGITKMFTRYGQIYREFDSNWDWMHHGEGYTSFYTLGLADPHDARFRDRARRFAAMYTGGDPEAPNYDPQRNMMRAVMNGSRGPKMEWNTRDWTPTNANLTYYHLPYDDIPGVASPAGWINDDQFAAIVKTMSDRMAKGDVPINLTATPLIADAYLYTGDAKYKDWVLRYVRGWEERTRANNGITPDNVGLSGKPGEYTNGNWWGGYYGWRWPRGGIDIVRAEITAARTAQLLTGEDRWFDLPRSQVALIRAQGKVERGITMTPQRHDQRGWNSPWPEPGYPYIRMWMATFHPDDWRHMQRIMSEPRGRRAGMDADFDWVEFLMGKRPAYPMDALTRDLAEVHRKVKHILEEHGDPETWVDSKWADVEPLAVDALVRLTLGGLPIDLRGERLYCALRYFDPVRREAGLPPDVAALVTRIEKDRVDVELVNTSASAERRVIVQGGAYGEHGIVSANGVAVNARAFEVLLEPGAGAKVEMAVKRFAHQPRYAWPWEAER